MLSYSSLKRFKRLQTIFGAVNLRYDVEQLSIWFQVMLKFKNYACIFVMTVFPFSHVFLEGQYGTYREFSNKVS